MTEVTEALGLCATCNFASSCVYRQGREGPIEYCEMFAEIIKEHGDSPGGLIAILEEIQSKYGYLPPEALKMVADKTKRALVDVYGVATFYRAFTLKPRGKHLVSCCLGTACHVRGGPAIAEEIQKQLGILSGETTPDKEFTLETVNCLGACALGPIVVVDGHYFSKVKTTMIKDILHKSRAGLDTVEIRTDQRIFPVEVCCPRCNHTLMDPRHQVDGLPAITINMALDGEYGWLRMSSLYGSYSIEAEFNVPPNKLVNFFCPHCHAELLGASNCPECQAKMVPMIVRGGGIVQICSRRGCKGHMLDLAGTITY
jgi:NADH-quinone oxidoreductase subunit E